MGVLSPEKKMARDRRSLWRAWWSVAHETAKTNYGCDEIGLRCNGISKKKNFELL
jgi:hypothetical protein